jgi:pimeloyl-ACP methyl ester carboxylesterase
MPGDFSCRDLFQQTQALVRVSVYDQNPQLETVNDSDLDLPFLGKGLAARRGGLTVSHRSQTSEWQIDAGRIHGIPEPEGAETTKLAIFPASSAASIERIGDSIAKAMVRTVEPGYSAIEVTRELDPTKTYRAAIVSLPVPLCRVELVGDPEGVEEIRTVLKGNLFAAELAGATLRVSAAGGKYTIARASDGRELTAAVEGYSYASTVVARLETIAKWNRIAILANPHSKISEDDFRLTIFSGTEGQKELEDREIRLSYEAGKNTAEPVPPKFRVCVKNAGTQTLYMALLDLDELFAVKSLFAAGSLKVGPGEEAWAFEGKAVRSVIHPDLIKAGATESTDILKLIVSTEDFDPRLLAQGALDAPRTRAASFAAVRRGTLNRMFERVQTRGFEADAGEDETVDDFTTRSIVFTTALPRSGVRLTTTAASTLDGNVEVQAHPAMTAVARLTSVSLSRDDLGGAVVPQILCDSPSELWNLMPMRGSTPELNALELTAIQNIDAVTPEQPLVLTIPIGLGTGECVLPYSYDGEFYLPAGLATSKEGYTKVTIERLIPNGRSLTGSIRIFFQKFVDSVLGLPFEYPILAGVDLDASGKVVYEKDIDKVHERVSKARRVLVFVHGIIGDTRGMPASIAAAPDDAVLTFDYENLDTTIEANAKKLGERLAQAGLGPGHEKELVLIAHSMGGLVSRWSIEMLGGNKVVTRLIMLGTPNGGSPWANIEDWVSTTAALAMNGLTKVHWPVTVISGLLRAPGRIDRSLHEMQADSQFLKNLAACPDPGIPYLIIAGDSALIEPPVNGSKIKRLLDRVLHRAASAAFFFDPNDIAVSVANINAVNARRNPQPIHQTAACDHLTYFSSDAGRDLLRAALAARGRA